MDRELPMPVDYETLIKDIAFTDRVSDAALRELVPHAAVLAPRIAALIRRRIDDDWLSPAELNLLLFGPFVVAAAQERSFWPAWLELAGQPQDVLESIFGDGVIQSVATVTLGLVGEDAATVAELAAKPALAADVRAGLVSALARLACEGRFPRSELVALIDLLAALSGTDDDDCCKWTAENAIVLGGIAERLELLERLWTTAAFESSRDIDKADARDSLGAAAADPADTTRFDADGVVESRDPAAGLRWLKTIHSHNADSSLTAPLTWRDAEWLAALFQRGMAPAAAMTFEACDGFFHAMAIGPDSPTPFQHLPVLWGAGPGFADEDDARRALELILRHWDGVVLRSETGADPVLWLEAHEGIAPGRKWAAGFARGMRLRAGLWPAAAEDQVAALSLAAILSLERDDLDDRDRTRTLHELAGYILDISAFWRRRERHTPAKSRKVGRNQPCPCGSGKKWKKCCGAATTAMVD